MSRCDYEGAFYRVFCVSLLVIAFTFTIILTNVFVDIDDILSKDEKEPKEKLEDTTRRKEDSERAAETQDYYIGAERNDVTDIRTKRSLSLDSKIHHINDKNARKFLTSKLASILEDLDEESENTTPTDNGNIYIKTVKQKNNIAINQIRPENKNENDVRLALNKVLLEGITGRLGVKELYKRLQTLVGYDDKDIKKEESSEVTTQGKLSFLDEQSLLEELLKLKIKEKESQDQTFRFHEDIDTDEEEEEFMKNRERFRRKKKNPKYHIKTLFNIVRDENIDTKENIQGTIKLMYNGRPIKLKNEDVEEATTATTPTPQKRKPTTDLAKTVPNTISKEVGEFADLLKQNLKTRHASTSYMRNLLLEYLKKLTNRNDSSTSEIKTKKQRTKRSSYHSIGQRTENEKKDDDELFVEIKTHYDKRGLTGDKKREIVSKLVEKIQRAINSESKQGGTDKSKLEPRIKARLQYSMDHVTTPRYFHTIAPFGLIANRKITDATVKHNESWKKEYDQPKFHSSSKSLNSEEMENDSKGTERLAMPERIQAPLMTDSSDEKLDTADLGKLHFLSKNIEGTGFSIGYNQYVDQAPDPESIKVFQDVESILKQYHQQYDKEHAESYEKVAEIKKREVKTIETVQRRKRFVINIHKVEQSGNEIEHLRNPHRSTKKYTRNNLHEIILYNNRNQAKTNTYRKKRSFQHNKMLNLGMRMPINRYLNTKVVPVQKHYSTVKRNKRHINKIVYTSKTGQRNVDGHFKVSVGNAHKGYLSEKLKRITELSEIYEQGKVKKGRQFLKNKPTYLSNSRYAPHNHNHLIINPNLYKKRRRLYYKQQNKLLRNEHTKERYKRQIENMKITSLNFKESNEKPLTEYEDIYADRSVIPLDGPVIVVSTDKETEDKNVQDLMNVQPINFNNPYPLVTNNQRVPDNPLFIGDEHVAFDSLTNEFRQNPLATKYPHLFVEDRITRGSQERKQFHRAVFANLRAQSKEVDMSSNRNVWNEQGNVKDLVDAIVPPQEKFRVKVKLTPQNNDNDNYNETAPAYKEVHTSINKSFNKHGFLFSSLVNVSKISKVEHSKNAMNTNVTNVCKQHCKHTTLRNTNTTNKTDANNDIEQSRTISGDNQLTEFNSERKQTPGRTNNDSRENATLSPVHMNLMDIILPAHPMKIFHLTAADIGKLLINSVKSRNPETTTTTTEKTTTKESTTMKINEITVQPKIHITETDDPFKNKLLKAISLNEQLTSKILDRIDQNTDTLQTFLTKISRDIANIPIIAEQATAKDSNKYNTFGNLNINVANPVNDTELSSMKQSQRTRNLNPKTRLQKNLIHAAPIFKKLITNERKIELERDIDVRNNDAWKRYAQTKYFIDYDNSRPTPDPRIPNEEDSSKQSVVALNNLEQNLTLDNTPEILTGGNNLVQIENNSTNFLV